VGPYFRSFDSGVAQNFDYTPPAMKLIRFGAFGREKPGVLVDGVRRDVSAKFRDWDREFFEGEGVAELQAALRAGASGFPEVVEGERWAACIARPGKVVCIGLNYKDHAREQGVELPKEPVLFMKATNTVVGPYDDVLIPRLSKKTDYEVELGVVIGKRARYLDSVEQAKGHIAGFCISHDVSEREFQIERSGQWTKGKSCDTFNPVGPFLATPDEIPDPHALGLELDVNGERRQTGNTREMAVGVYALVHYISQFMTLEGGDLLSTGTPSGVAMSMNPQRFLVPGDVCELRIGSLGVQRQTFRQA
jgi:2-keto-4-pentenoate hydratase/2-oxohepta-3-ene-1,7-dioic acid hydratase in catechol pathway